MTPRRAPPCPNLDFAGGLRRPSVLGWLLLGLGLVASAGVLHEYDVLETRVADETRALARVQRHAGAGRVAPARLPAPVAEAELKPALAVAHVLNRDGLALLSALEQAADDPGVALLEVDQDGTRGLLKLAGEARSLPEAFAFVERLAACGLRDARLSGYEFRQEGPVQVLRFHIQARWEASR